MNLNHTFIKKQSDTSHRILSSALSWFGLGMLIVFSLGYGFTVIPALNQIFYSIMSMPSGFIILTIASIGMMLAIVYGAWKFNLSTLIILFVAFCLIESFYIALIFATYAANYSKLLLVFGIPAFTFAIMGLLGYFQVFNFGKLWLFLLISTIGLIVFGIATYFIKSSFVTMLYAIIGYIIFHNSKQLFLMQLCHLYISLGVLIFFLCIFWQWHFQATCVYGDVFCCWEWDDCCQLSSEISLTKLLWAFRTASVIVNMDLKAH